MFGPEVDAEARAHAVHAAPRECVGLVLDGRYVRCRNAHEQPRHKFRLGAQDQAKALRADAIVHSHVAENGDGREPSAADMRSQIATAKPWGIVWCVRGGAVGPLWFGDHVLDAPLIGREFVHGVTDCYGLIRAWFWQARKAKLPEVPRDIDWWKERRIGEATLPRENLFADGFAAAGFVEIDPGAAAEGDVLLMKIGAKVANHGAVLLGNGLILHHPGGGPRMLSRAEPLGEWGKFVIKVLRHAP